MTFYCDRCGIGVTWLGRLMFLEKHADGNFYCPVCLDYTRQMWIKRRKRIKKTKN